MSSYKKYRVKKKVAECKGVVSLYLQPADGSPVTPFAPGQHLMFRIYVPGHELPFYRYYSFSDSYDENGCRISLKKQAPGICSAHMHNLNEGDILEAKGPAGSFIIEPAGNEPVVLIAGGIGITPLLCMLKSIAQKNPTRTVYFYYGVNNKDEYAFREELLPLKKDHPNFHINTFFVDANGAADDEYDHKGFVNTGIILQQTGGSQYTHYICGPDAMVQAVKNGLTAAGIDEDKILTEAFTAFIQEEAPVVRSDAHLLHFTKTGKKLYWDQRYRSILEFAEANDIEISSGCLFGDCGTCLTRMQQGEVRYNHVTMVDPGPGHCLPCSCIPASELVLFA